jgi:hypothetical protein
LVTTNLTVQRGHHQTVKDGFFSPKLVHISYYHQTPDRIPRRSAIQASKSKSRLAMPGGFSHLFATCRGPWHRTKPGRTVPDRVGPDPGTRSRCLARPRTNPAGRLDRRIRRGRWRLRAVYKPQPAFAFPLPLHLSVLLTNQTNPPSTNGRARVAAAGGRQGVRAAPPPRAGRAPGIRASLPALLCRPPPPRRSPRSARMLPFTHVTIGVHFHFINGVERMSLWRVCVATGVEVVAEEPPGREPWGCPIGCCGLHDVMSPWVAGA